MVRVLVNGSKGKMGQEVVRAVGEDPQLELVGSTDVDDNLKHAIEALRPDVVVDFTTAAAGVANAELILALGVHPVIGTSGFKEPDVKRLQSVAADKNLGGVIAPNFAIGAVLMMKFAQEAAKHLPHVEIIELHHDGKADSPSGTAVRTAELIAAARAEAPASREELQIVPGARGAELNSVHIHSVRLPGFVAKQQVIFGAKGQTLTLTHDSNHRESFMPGVCLACREVVKRKELYYGLEHLL
ncbi:MAG: 4-hydroxy-tetrahydrodipicolinate reductase [Bdellovibrionota bacterium]